MTNRRSGILDRRHFLCLLGGAAALPLVAACTPPEEAEPPPTTDTDPREQETDNPVPPDAASEPEPGQPPGQAGSADPDAANPAMLPRLDESDTMAQALGYKNDASQVDAQQFPSRADPGSANEFCKNCVHFQGPPDQQWAACTIFPGKLVNADGWCSAWAAQA